MNKVTGSRKGAASAVSHDPRRVPISVRFVSIAALLLSLLLLTSCTANDSLGQQARDGSDKNYIAGDGSVTEYEKNERGEPLEVTSVTYDEKKIDTASWKGKPAVLNFWYAACAPCRTEAPDLEALYQEFHPQGVEFLGVNVRDDKGTADAFIRQFNVQYPNVDDTDGEVLLALGGIVPPKAVPTTVVLDSKGRVAARVLGVVDPSIMQTILRDELAEQS